MADRAARDAIRYAVDVRSFDPRHVWGELTVLLRDDPHRVLALVVALAAMVDTDQPMSRLLSWTDDLDGDLR